MFGKKDKEYQRLPGRKRHAFGYNTLYLGQDHLLLVSSRGMSEDYKRFYYRDIQAFITRKTAWGKVNNVILGLMAAGMGFWTWYVGWADGGMVLVIFTAFFLIGLLGNIIMGPTSVCHVQTAVQREKLPSLNRIRTARRAIGRIKPHLEATQGLLKPERLAGVQFTAAGPQPLTPQLKTVSITYHRLLFYLILLGGVVTALDVYINHPAVVVAETLLGMATPVLAILALVRQHESNLSRRLQLVTWASLVYVGLVFLFTSISSTVVAITNPAQSNKVWELIKLRAEIPLSENPWLLGLSVFFIFFAGILSALGLSFLSRARDPEPGSDQDPGRADLKTALDQAMEALSHQRCFNHPVREAVARCPECGRFFCRECITEHEDRVLCAQCLRKRLDPVSRRGRRYGVLSRLAQLLLGLWLAWLFFHYLGEILLALPTEFHEGVIWSKDWWNL